jgi:HlyD family secretion protein
MSIRTIAAVATLAGLAALGAGYRAFTAGTPVDAVPAARGPIREYVDEEGKTRLPRTYLITMPFDGRILPIELEPGDPVEAEQVVARIVPEDLAVELAEAEAAVARLEESIRENADTRVEHTVLEQSRQYVESMDRTVEAGREQVKAGEAKRAFADRELGRKRGLRERGAASIEELNRAEVDQVQADVELRQDVLIARALESLRAATALLPTAVSQYIARKELRVPVLRQEKAEAEARLARARLRRRRGTMASPVAGVVLRREVTSERQLAAGAVLLEIGRLDDLEVTADVLSQEAMRIAPGQPVEIRGPGLGTSPARGTVRRVEPAGFTKVSSLGVEQQRVPVVASFHPSDLARLRGEGRLGVGYRVQVRVITAARAEALAVPRSALFRGPAGDWRVYAIRDGRARVQAVRVGLSNDEQAEIVEGLRAGDLVIPAPESDLADGSRVRPIPSPPRGSDDLEPGPSAAGTAPRGP